MRSERKEKLIRIFLMFLQNSHSYSKSAINAEIEYTLKENLTKSDILATEEVQRIL